MDLTSKVYSRFCQEKPFVFDLWNFGRHWALNGGTTVHIFQVNLTGIGTIHGSTVIQ